MSMGINTNVSALNALSNLETTNAALSRSVERLSSGLRINRASDDPAGLIISENLRSQIAGQQQAVKNAQDASNLINTADGSLSQINDLLRSIRTLAVHASNTGVNDATAVQADQTQIASALASIDRIANQTSFGSKHLLDGTSGISSAAVDTTRVAGTYFGGVFGTYPTQAGNVTITVLSQAARAEYASGRTFADGAATTIGIAGRIVLNGQTIAVNDSDTVQGVLDKINALSSVTHVSANMSGNSVVLKQQVYGVNNWVNYYESNGIFNASASSANVSGASAVVLVTANVMKDGIVQPANVTMYGGQSAGTDGLRVSDTEGNSLLLTEAGNNATSTVANVVATVNAASLQFQVGANAGQYVSMSLGNIQTDQLGNTVNAGKSVREIDVTTAQGAAEALNMIDEAIGQVSSLRAQLGAFQTNTLQSTISYLGVSVQNLSSSNSQIQDTDVASEVVSMTKNQILEQAGTSVLKTANNLPQQVLTLLQ
jgi:flagellin